MLKKAENEVRSTVVLLQRLRLAINSAVNDLIGKMRKSVQARAEAKRRNRPWETPEAAKQVPTTSPWADYEKETQKRSRFSSLFGLFTRNKNKGTVEVRLKHLSKNSKRRGR